VLDILATTTVQALLPRPGGDPRHVRGPARRAGTDNDGFVGRRFDPLAEWHLHARDAQSKALRGGHFFLDEPHDETVAARPPFMLG
jgi:hypothetical protein